MTPTDDKGVHAHDYRDGLHRCICGATDTDAPMVDGTYGPVTVTTMQVWMETEDWTPLQLRHEIVRLRLLLGKTP